MKYPAVRKCELIAYSDGVNPGHLPAIDCSYAVYPSLILLEIKPYPTPFLCFWQMEIYNYNMYQLIYYPK